MIQDALDKINLVEGHDVIGYHNYKELAITDHNLIGQRISKLKKEGRYSFISKMQIVDRYLEKCYELQQINKEIREREYNSTLSLLNKKDNLDDFEKNKDNHHTMFERFKGGAYTFTTDKVYPLILNANLLSTVFIPTLPRHEDVEKKLYRNSSIMNRDLLSEYDVPTNFTKHFRVKDNRLFFAKAITVKEVERVYEFILNNDNVIIPCLHSCEVCDYHHNNRAVMDKHLLTESCRIARGLMKEKVKTIFYCKECESEWIDKTMYNRHRGSTKCKRKHKEAGLVPLNV